MKKLVIAKMPIQEKEAVVTMLLESDKPVELYVDGTGERTRAGDIYVGHVDRVMEKSGGAFVRFKEKETGFLPANRMKGITFCTPKSGTQIKAGDECIVRVETESRGNKQAVLNAAIKGGKQFVSAITETGIHRPWGTCLHKGDAPWKYLYERYKKEGFERIVTDVPEAFEDLGESAVFYEDIMVSLYRLYSMSAVLDGFLQKRVWLPGGGNITVEQTEAFVCVDVNSAKTGASKDVEKTVSEVNKEAVTEAFRQIRCRGLSGTILIDLIPMKEEEHKKELLALATELASKEVVYTSVIDITPLTILEVTRHKVKKSLREQIAEV